MDGTLLKLILALNEGDLSSRLVTEVGMGEGQQLVL